MQKTFITSVVAHIDHGKTTLIDSLISATGHINKSVAGDIRYLDTREDEQSRGITLKLSAIELFYTHKYIILDTPGHVDFESIVQISSQLVDSFILIIDVNEGITPRLFSIIKFITKNTILVINKIDKQLIFSVEEIYNTVMNIIIKVNSLFKYDQFDWDKNNVIIAWSTFCVGVSKNELKKITVHCNLKNCIRFLVELDRRVKLKDIGNLVKKFNIKNTDDKSVWSTVLPLAKVLFEAIASNFDASTVGNNEVKALTMYGMLKGTKELKIENIYFMVRLFSGNIQKGEELKCKNDSNEKTFIVQELYNFGVNGIKRNKEIKAPSLFLIKGDILKHSHIYKDDLENLVLENIHHKPTYKAKIMLTSNNNSVRFKEALKALSFLEPIFKAKINKFGEYEFFCEGRVQFEKIIQDLLDDEFDFNICEEEYNFRETPGKILTYNHTEGIKISKDEKRDGDSIYTIGTNTLVFNYNIYQYYMQSVFEYFVENGPLIREPIMFLYIKIEIPLDVRFEEPYTYFEDAFRAAYNSSNPRAVPFYYLCKIQTTFDYLYSVYQCLHKYFYTLKEEIYDENTDFYILSVYIPQFQYYEFVEDLRMKTKGTCYIEFEEYNYMVDDRYDFKEYVDKIKRKKGMFTEDITIKDPEKQRTRKK